MKNRAALTEKIAEAIWNHQSIHGLHETGTPTWTELLVSDESIKVEMRGMARAAIAAYELAGREKQK